LRISFCLVEKIRPINDASSSHSRNNPIYGSGKGIYAFVIVEEHFVKAALLFVIAKTRLLSARRCLFFFIYVFVIGKNDFVKTALLFVIAKNVFVIVE